MVLIQSNAKNGTVRMTKLFEFEGDFDFRLIFPVLDGCEFDAQLFDFNPVDVIKRRLGAVDGVVDGTIETFGALADQGNLLVYHDGSLFDVLPEKSPAETDYCS